MSDDQINHARRQAEEARARLMEDVHILQDRLRPANLADEAVESAKAKGWRAIELARRNPVTASAGALGVLLLIARKPIVGLIRQWRKNDERD